MRRDLLAVDNSIQVLIRHLYAVNDPTTPITDATLTYTIFDSADDAVTGGDDVSMPHDSVGTYFGNCTPTLVAGSRYKVVVSCSNYLAEWTRYFSAKVRSFDM